MLHFRGKVPKTKYAITKIVHYLLHLLLRKALVNFK